MSIGDVVFWFVVGCGLGVILIMFEDWWEKR